MKQVAVKKDGEVTLFDPKGAGIKIAAIDAARALAKKLKDWESLDEAVKEQIKFQKALVAWWDGNVQGPGGDRQSKKHSRSTRRMLSEKQAEQKTKLRHQQVSRWRGYLKTAEDEEKYRKRLFGRPYQDAMGIPKGTKGTGVDEWYTPAEYVDSVRMVLGEIDLDPASSDEAQKVIQAKRYYTIADDALSQQWKAATVFMNPPYSAANIKHFVDRLVSTYVAGDIGAAIMLTNNFTDTRWFHGAEKECSAICFTRGRIHYYDADGNTSMPTNGQVFFYFGHGVKRFKKYFERWGFIR